MQQDTSVSILAIFCIVVFSFIVGFILGIACKTNDNQDTYRTLYCQTFKETQQYIDCMNKPLEDTFK